MRTDWYALNHELTRALRGCGAFPPSVPIDGKIRQLGTGLGHENYLFFIADDGTGPGSTAYVLRRARLCEDDGDTGDSSLGEEARVLQALGGLERHFDAPQFICFIDPSKPKAGFIETAVAGFPLQLLDKKSEPHSAMLLKATAAAAAAVHRLPLQPFSFLASYADARTHLEVELNRVERELVQPDAELTAAAAWVKAHPPANRPSVLLHGNLLAHSLFGDFDSPRIGVVDWAHVRIGDPAYDLAIVSRGTRKVLGHSLSQLVDAYRTAGGADVSVMDVFNWELVQVSNWLAESIRAYDRGPRHGHPPEFYRASIRAILQRAETERR